jgi:hypothetical protein
MAGIAEMMADKVVGAGPPAAEEAQGDDMGLEAGAHDLIKAIHSADAPAVVEAFRNMFSIMEGQPHEEAGGEPPGEPAEAVGPE